MDLKNIHLEMAHHPQTILDAMERMEHEPQRLQQQNRRPRTLACGGALTLAGIGLILLIADLSLHYGSLLIVTALILWALAVLLGVVFVAAPSATATTSAGPSRARKQFEATRQILHTLRDDTGRNGRVVGWLDLVGQHEQQVRTGTSSSGKRKVYSRHPWFKVKIRLADGNALHLSLEDRIKTKSGLEVARRTLFAAKLVVNPNLYQIGDLPIAGIPDRNAALSHDDGIFTVMSDLGHPYGPGSNHKDSIDRSLERLRVLYAQLRPIVQASDTSVEELGMEA